MITGVLLATRQLSRNGLLGNAPDMDRQVDLLVAFLGVRWIKETRSNLVSDVLTNICGADSKNWRERRDSSPRPPA